jgi:hypothetical protein
MKYLSDYTRDVTKTLFSKYNAFFAFNDKQFNEGKREGVDYKSLGVGLHVETSKVKEFNLEFLKIVETAITQDLAENGKDNVIERELSNYECYYTYEIDDAVDALTDYNITREEIQQVFNKNKQNHLDD